MVETITLLGSHLQPTIKIVGYGTGGFVWFRMTKNTPGNVIQSEIEESRAISRANQLKIRFKNYFFLSQFHLRYLCRLITAYVI
jgi:hypothetical protein